jgi:hypothetical protein
MRRTKCQKRISEIRMTQIKIPETEEDLVVLTETVQDHAKSLNSKLTGTFMRKFPR